MSTNNFCIQSQSPPTSSPSHSLLNCNHQITLKLTRDNYLLWRTLMLPYLEGQELLGYIIGAIQCPFQFIATTSNSTTSATIISNPAYSARILQDKLILSAILSTMFETTQTHVVNLHTSLEVWSTLEKIFSSQSKACVMQSRYQLATLKKGAPSIAYYFQKVQKLAHTLAAIDETLKDSELVSYLLAGLGSDYDPFITSITTRIDPISLDELFGYLLTQEQRLEHSRSAGDLSVSSVNAAQRNNFVSHKQQRPPHFSYGAGRGHRGRGRGCSFPNSGLGSSSPSNQSSPFSTFTLSVCLLCFKVSHTVAKCYHRFDHSYQGEYVNPSAFLTTPQVPFDLNWYHDTGSTHHLTHDLSNLNVRADAYHGTDQIQVGNGQGLDILHTGSALLSPTHSNFSLQHLLHVPQIQKNLILVNKFTHDNRVFIEFHPYFLLCQGSLHT